MVPEKLGIAIKLVVLQDVKSHPLPTQIGRRPHGKNPHRAGIAPHIGRVAHAPAFHSKTPSEIFPARLI